MLRNVEVTIGTGARHVFRSRGGRSEQLAQIERPTFLARARGNIYGVSEVGDGKVFRLGGAHVPTSGPGTIPIGGPGGTPLGTGLVGEPLPSGGAHPCHISAAPDGSWVYVSNYGDGVVRAVEIARGGEFGDVVDLHHTGSGPVASRQGGPHAHFSAVVRDHLVIADLGTDQLRVHPLTAGRPAEEGALVHMPAGSGPRHFTRVGDVLIVAGELDGSVTEVDTTTWRRGRSVPAATARGEHYLSHILHTHGVFVVGVRGSNTLSVLDRELRIVQEVPTARWPRHFALSRSHGRAALIVAGERSNEVVWHPLDQDGSDIRVGGISNRVRVATPMFIGVGEEF